MLTPSRLQNDAVVAVHQAHWDTCFIQVYESLLTQSAVLWYPICACVTVVIPHFMQQQARRQAQSYLVAVFCVKLPIISLIVVGLRPAVHPAQLRRGAVQAGHPPVAFPDPLPDPLLQGLLPGAPHSPALQHKSLGTKLPSELVPSSSTNQSTEQFSFFAAAEQLGMNNAFFCICTYQDAQMS